MHDGMQCDPIQVKVKVTSPSKLEIRPFSKATLYLLRHLQWQLATDHGFLNYGTAQYLNLVVPDLGYSA